MELYIDDRVDAEAKKDILELHHAIEKFQSGNINAESFRAFRLARGVYGQRQDGVQMIRIKLPFGKVTPQQLIRIADLSDAYGSSNLHMTTRQDIQLHYVKLKDAPQLWAKLEEKGITLREACGNTIRNLTASYMSGIDPEEPFDVTPYASAMFRYFLRNAICQELGRKFKIAFASSDSDSAITFIHDLGFIPKVRTVDGKAVRGFKVVLGGGLGAQPFLAHEVAEFLDEDQVIPFSEAVIRIFDRYGERVRRHKARLKYLIQDLGLDHFMELVAGERLAIKTKSFPIDLDDYPSQTIPIYKEYESVDPHDLMMYEKWMSLNVFQQKQQGRYGVKIKLPLGNLLSDTARALAHVIEQYGSDDIRITINQGLLIKYVQHNALVPLFNSLHEIGLAEPGFDTLFDITACPGTDTCNLGIASSMGLAEELERVLKEEYSDTIYLNHIKIKISGCMNACGHHTIANIGLHGMSIKIGAHVLPAMQVMLGGGSTGNGTGRLAEKIIKLPSKKVPDALRALLADFEEGSIEGEYFNDYIDRMGKNYFYLLLKPFSILETVTQKDLLDWGSNTQYETMIGIGECAGVLIDMVALVLDDAKTKLDKATESFEMQQWVDVIYYSYSSFIHAAKALLLTRELACNTQHSIMTNFEKAFIDTKQFPFAGSYKDKVLEINKEEPSELFAARYKREAENFLAQVIRFRVDHESV